MNFSRRLATVVAVGSLVAGCVALAITPAAATSRTVRYASPRGVPSAKCLKPHPCDIVTAIGAAGANALVILEAGNYGTEENPMSEVLGPASDATGITIRGAGPDKTVLHMNPTEVPAAFYLTPAHSTIEGIKIIYSGSESGGALALMSNTAAARDIIAIATGPTPACAPDGGTLSDSLCIATGGNQQAVEVTSSQGTATSGTIRNVTAEATGINAIGIADDVLNAESESLTVVNSIGQGEQADLEVSAATGGTATVTVSHSAVDTTAHGGDGGTETLNLSSTDTHATPRFVNPATDNYRERAGGPTIDRGAPDPGDPSDLAGSPRTLGAAPDMGAYEFLPPPFVSDPLVSSVTTSTAKVRVREDSEGLGTHVELIVVGHKRLHSRVVFAGKSRAIRIVHLVLPGLAPHTTYRIAVVATSKGGRTTKTGFTVKTK